MNSDPIERVWSPDGKSRASIFRRVDGRLVVEIERLVPGDRSFEEPDYWARVGGEVVVVDTLERALELASERLHSFSASG